MREVPPQRCFRVFWIARTAGHSGSLLHSVFLRLVFFVVLYCLVVQTNPKDRPPNLSRVFCTAHTVIFRKDDHHDKGPPKKSNSLFWRFQGVLRGRPSDPVAVAASRETLSTRMKMKMKICFWWRITFTKAFQQNTENNVVSSPPTIICLGPSKIKLDRNSRYAGAI